MLSAGAFAASAAHQANVYIYVYIIKQENADIDKVDKGHIELCDTS